MSNVRRTTATVFALVLGMLGLTGPAAFAAVEPQEAAVSGTTAVFIPVQGPQTSGAFDGWQLLLAGAAAAAVAVILTVLVQHLVATHHSRTAFAGA